MNTSENQQEQSIKEQSELGKKSEYDSQYNPGKLFAIPRASKRIEINIDPDNLPFYGFDRWNHYEVSWLNPKGKPLVAIAEIIYDCRSPMIVESKSLKLYFNSFNNSHFESCDGLTAIIRNDLSKILNTEVKVRLTELHQLDPVTLQPGFDGENIDHIDVDCDVYTVNPDFLHCHETIVEETLVSDLLKSNCLVTHQPDWGSVMIEYRGNQIDRAGLLKYIVSFRNHNEFHEQCIERIFNDILQRCKPETLTVYGRYTRRGGLDINPCRSTESELKGFKHHRLIRQ